MKTFVATTIALYLLACANNNSSKNNSFFDESEYRITRVKKDDSGKKIASFFVNKKDETKKMIKLYWDNGKVQANVYLKNNDKNGPYQEFDSSGKLYFSGFYLNNKETGISCYYNTDGSIKKLEVVDGNKILNSFNDSLYEQ